MSPTAYPCSAFSPPSSPDSEEEGDRTLSRATLDPTYGIKSFHLQPAPRDRKSARARSPRLRRGSHGSQSGASSSDDGSSTRLHGTPRGKFQEHLSWDARPSSNELDTPPRLLSASTAPSAGVCTADSGLPLAAREVDESFEAIEATKQTLLRRKPSVPYSVYEEVLTPSSLLGDTDVFPLPRPADVVRATDGQHDANVRLSAQAGSVASSRRTHATKDGAATTVPSPRRISLSSATARLRRFSSASSLRCSSPRSPRSPVSQMVGRRGQERLKRQRDSTILSLPPMSPLTPRRADTLHSPTVCKIGEHVPAEAAGRSDIDTTPLSATLREIGAKRASIYYTPEGGEEKKAYNVPTWASKFQANHHRRNLLESNKKAVNAFRPIKAIAEQQQQQHDETGADVSYGLPQLTIAGDRTPHSPNGDLLSGDVDETLCTDTPSRTRRSDEAQEWVQPTTVKPLNLPLRRHDTKAPRPPLPPKLQSVGRGLSHPPQDGGFSNRVTDLVDAIKTFRTPPRRAGAGGWNLRIPYRRTPDQQDVSKPTAEERRDGWGGVMTRCSWFSSGVKGPLVSPLPPLHTDEHTPTKGFDGDAPDLAKPSISAKKTERRARFRSLHLAETIPIRPFSLTSAQSEEAWEDLPSPTPSSCSSSDETLLSASLSTPTPFDKKPSLEHGTPRFVKTVDPSSFCKPTKSTPTRDGAERKTGWQRLFDLGRLASSSSLSSLFPPTPLQKPKQGGFLYDDEVFVIGRPSSSYSLPALHEKSDGGLNEKNIVKVGQDNIESVPMSSDRSDWSGKKTLMVLLVVILVASVGLNVALLVKRSDQGSTYTTGGDSTAAAFNTTDSSFDSSISSPISTSASSPSASATIEPSATSVELPTALSSSMPTEASSSSSPDSTSADPIQPTATPTATPTVAPELDDETTPESIEAELERQGRISEVRHAVSLSHRRRRALLPLH